MAHFSACKKIEDISSAMHLFFWDMLRLHGVPTDKFSTQLQFCSAFYLQLDGQTKAVNFTLSNVLCCVGIDKQQN